MEKEHSQRIELFHQPRLILEEAYTGPDILHPTHQLYSTSIKLRRESIDKIISSDHSQTLMLRFTDNFGTDIDITISTLRFIETPNPDIVTVYITGLFPLSEMHRIQPPQGENASFGY